MMIWPCIVPIGWSIWSPCHQRHCTFRKQNYELSFRLSATTSAPTYICCYLDFCSEFVALCQIIGSEANVLHGSYETIRTNNKTVNEATKSANRHKGNREHYKQMIINRQLRPNYECIGHLTCSATHDSDAHGSPGAQSYRRQTQ